MGRARSAGIPALAPGLWAGQLGPHNRVPTCLGWGGGAPGRAGALVDNADFPSVCSRGCHGAAAAIAVK